MPDRIRMKLLLKEQSFNNVWQYRTILRKDVHSLGVLMLEAYQGTIDYEGETLEDAVREVQATIDGKYGPFLNECSFLIEEGERILSACMVAWSERMQLPLLAYSMTHPAVRSQGMATFLIKKSINALHAKRYKEIYLVVTEGNEAAQHLYKKIGFRPFE